MIEDSIITTIGEALGLLEKLSPAINAWILAKIPEHEQHIMDRRIRRCKRICRHGHFMAPQIVDQVALDFIDLTDTQLGDITSLLDFELLKPTK